MFLPDSVESAFQAAKWGLRRHLTLVTVLLVFMAQIVLARAGLLMPRPFRLRRKGLDLLLKGNPAEAETCFRTALGLGAEVPAKDRLRLTVCLGDALFDQGKYDEAKQSIARALELGDPTGSGQGSMCDILLALKATPEKAIDMADEALRLHKTGSASQSFGNRWAAAKQDLYEAKTWARKTTALVLLDRRTEARQAMDRALRIMEMSKSELQSSTPETSMTGRLILGSRLGRMKSLAISDTNWQIGLALLALRDPGKAAEHFLIVRNVDRIGKYRNLAQAKLDQLGYGNAATR